MRLWAAAAIIGLAVGCKSKHADVGVPDASFVLPSGYVTAPPVPTQHTPEAPAAVRALVAQYETAKATGDAMTMCTYAGMVVAAYIQAKDAAKAKEWKVIEKADCSKAGVPSL